MNTTHRCVRAARPVHAGRVTLPASRPTVERPPLPRRFARTIARAQRVGWSVERWLAYGAVLLALFAVGMTTMVALG